METAVTEVQDVPKALELWDSGDMTPCSLVAKISEDRTAAAFR